MPEAALPLGSGKVRELYALDDERLLLVTSDRISVFDVVLGTAIPDKGKVLTGLSAFWFKRTHELVPNHLLALRADGRSLECRRVEMLPIECVVRGYLAGSGWKEYRSQGTVCGHRLPAGLGESDRLPEPILTPATKAATGHDENITEQRARELVGKVYDLARGYSLAIYARAARLARAHGILIADTKFEFGIAGGEVLLIDEVLTPDSSRFWPADTYEAGSPQASFDKQFVRDWLDAQGWNHAPPPPHLPPDIVDATAGRYVEAYERVTGRPFDSWAKEVGG